MLHVSLYLTLILSLTTPAGTYRKLPYWWTSNVLQVIAAKFSNKEPINDTIEIPAHYLDFMRRCWSIDNERRPSMEDVLDFLEEVMSIGAASR